MLKVIRPTPRDAFGALSSPPDWLAQEMDHLNGQVDPRSLRCLSIFVDDSALPPAPNLLGRIWAFVSGSGGVSDRERVLTEKGRDFFGITGRTPFPFALPARSSGGVVYMPDRTSNGPQLAVVVHHARGVATPNPETHDPSRSSVSGDSLRQAAFLMLAGHALNAHCPVPERVAVAGRFAVKTLLDRGDDNLASTYVAVGALENLRSMHPVRFNVLALRAQMGRSNGNVSPAEEIEGMCELHLRLTLPDAAHAAWEVIRTDLALLQSQLTMDNGLDTPRDKLALQADLVRVAELRQAAPLSPAAHLMAGILLESAEKLGCLPPVETPNPRHSTGGARPVAC